ncbi:hypothetical protein D3C73_928680 [compost metagenome]
MCQGDYIAVTCSRIYAFAGPLLAGDIRHLGDVAAQGGKLHGAYQHLRDFAAVSRCSGTHRIKHQRHAMGIGRLSGQYHRCDGMFIQCTDIQHHRS